MVWVVDLNVENKMVETVHTVRMGQPKFRKYQLLKVYFSQIYFFKLHDTSKLLNHSKLRKQRFFAELFKFLALSRHPYACVQEKFVPRH